MIRTRRTKARGAGTIEILVASAATLLVLAACARTSLQSHELWRREHAHAELRESARRATDAMAREIRSAGFDPLTTGSFDGRANGISIAAADRIELLADHRGGASTSMPDGELDDSSDERIGFRPGAGGTSLQQSIGGLVTPLLGEAEIAPGGLRFTYHDACGTELTPATTLTPTERASVRSISITLTLRPPGKPTPLVTSQTTASLRNRQHLRCED